ACLLVITGSVAGTTETVERAGLNVWDPRLPREIQRPAQEGAGLAGVALAEHGFAQADERFGLVGHVVHVPEQDQCLLEVVRSLPMTAEPQAGLPQAGQGHAPVHPLGRGLVDLEALRAVQYFVLI